MIEHAQVVVVGGGPAGATAAALLAREGISVVLLEKETFPRYHIGESLLLSCVPIFELSGAADRIRAHGFQTKRGAVIHWGADAWVVDWAAIVGPDASSWQVDRATFDQLLLTNAEDQGATVISGATAREVVYDGDRPVAVRWRRRDDPDRTHTTRCDFLIDASGRAGLLATRYTRNRVPHTVFQNVAAWSYWDGARPLPDAPEGAVHSLAAESGWWWAIPLADGRLSLGYVTHRDHFRDLRSAASSLDDYYMSQRDNHDTVRWMTDAATRVDQVRAEQDYSYTATRFSGPGYLMVGDAACFLDPLLSTGVHLAAFSATIAAATLISVINNEVSEPDGLGFFEYTYRRSYARLITLVSHLYERYEGKDNFFWQAQRLRRVPDTRDGTPLVEAFVDITAGNTDLREAFDPDTRILTEELLHEGLLVQAQTAPGIRGAGIPGVDMSPVRELDGRWDTYTLGNSDLTLAVHPRLGLARIPATPLAVTPGT